MQTSLKNPIFATLVLPPLKSAPTQMRNSIVCSRKRRWRPFLNRKTSKLILETALTVASNLNVVPPPVTALIREFGGGGGGGLGSRRGGGGGGFGWWRRRGRKLGFVVLVVAIGMRLCAGKKVGNDVVFFGIVHAVVGGLVGFGNVRVGDWVVGLCSCAGIVYLQGPKREQMRTSGGR